MPRPIFDITLLGDKKLERKLARLERAAQRKIVRKAMREAAKLLKAKAEQRIPVDSGNLKSAGLRIRAIKRSRKFIGVLLMTPTRAKLGLNETEYYYPAAIELGTWKLANRSFMRHATDTERSKALRVIAREIRSGLLREARK